MPETAEPADIVAGAESGGASGPELPRRDVAGPDGDGRSRVSPWLMVLPWAGLTIAVLAPFAVSQHDERSVAASLAAVAVPTLVIAAIAALVAARSGSGWSWWLYPLIVVLPAVVLVVLTDRKSVV